MHPYASGMHPFAHFDIWKPSGVEAELHVELDLRTLAGLQQNLSITDDHNLFFFNGGSAMTHSSLFYQWDER